MSKEIITNGIDVSECSYYNKDNEPNCCEVWDNECEAQNCYFKQLKRLQQENEELKSLLDFEIQKREVFADKSIKYEFALEEIKENICKIDDVDKWIELDLLPTDVCEEIKQINNKINEVLNVENN